MKSFLAAMHKFQGMVHAVERDRANPHFKSRYATLEKVCDTIRPAMQSCGLVWMQMPGQTNEHGLAIRTIIAHAESGEMLEQTMVVPLAKRDPQGVGSALTYGMRYSLMAALGLPPTDDDDGNDGSKPAPKPASSASLKRDGAWDKVADQVNNELLDVHSLPALESLTKSWRDDPQVKSWPAAWKYALKDIFETKRAELNAQGQHELAAG